MKGRKIMKNDIKILQIKIQMNKRHLIVLYQKGEEIKEYDLLLGIEESKKKIYSIGETKKHLEGDESAEPDLSLIHDCPEASALYWGSYGPKDQEEGDKESIQYFSSEIKKLEMNIKRTIELTQEYYLRTGDDMSDDFKKFIEEVVEVV
jgi:hypothetical protein